MAVPLAAAVLASVRIVLIRHGETVWNIEGRVQGSEDSPLTEKGLLQASATGRRLARMAELHPTIFSSPLPRAYRTAELIGAELFGGARIQSDQRLSERSFGIFEGRCWPDIQTQYAEELARSQSDPSYAVPGGESRQQVLERALECLHDIAATTDAKVVAVVTHSGLMSCVLKHVLGLRQDQPRTFAVPNLGFTELEFNARDECKLRTLGDVSHLENACPAH
ncbi:hypothetical protein AB1Y20_010518 [Prymnesium parvum]|uniref:Histidine phosphatase family protein n=1 Tax=Prymnesium parvum TaxID=97485 RepID=A0AB34IRB8_PRYPA